eukprot:320304-Chlamydomonas_euryale.AAC.1
MTVRQKAICGTGPVARVIARSASAHLGMGKEEVGGTHTRLGMGKEEVGGASTYLGMEKEEIGRATEFRVSPLVPCCVCLPSVQHVLGQGQECEGSSACLRGLHQ